MTPVWPADLPRPQRSGYQAQNADPRRKRSAESGPPRYGRKYSSVPREVSLSVVLTRMQKQLFDHFHDVVLDHGTHRFWMPDPISDGWPLVDGAGAALLSPEGEPLLMASRWLCSMGDQPPVEGPIKGLRFPVSFSVVVMP